MEMFTVFPELIQDVVVERALKQLSGGCDNVLAKEHSTAKSVAPSIYKSQPVSSTLK